ncbi:MAG: hypothetical protein OXC92_04085 [Flavobacteriaceae bacterium]|nr:hypothetical protein [Flavobacteriaceae bacterium]MCY4216149.1 hypothetical protein [Flavobacteriaceae bacterium]MCY4254158.1 hypothetical protein [Flavobacteriaceae bacterium]
MSAIPENLSLLKNKVNQLLDLMTVQKRQLNDLSLENKNLIAENSSLRNELETIQISHWAGNDVEFFKGSEKGTSKTKARLNQIIEQVDQCIEDFSRITLQATV